MKGKTTRFWVIADLHFGHARMIEFCGRPALFEHKLLNQIKHKVKKEDVLIVLGDFCIGEDAHWHQQFRGVCPGKRWLVRGNHDRKSMPWYMSHGWHFVADRIDLNLYGLRIALTHKPLEFVEDVDFNIHGHHHITEHHPEDSINSKHLLIYPEHEYTPLDLRQIINK